jgi:tetratricopeptide (TPR) repeat protein
MAGTYQKEAKKPSDFALAIDAYQDALKIAPWWGDAYYNLSVSLESAGELDKAKNALNLYLLTKPKDAEEVQNRLYALDAKKHLAAKQAAEAASEKAAKGDSRLVGLWTNAEQGKPVLIAGTRRFMEWTISATGSGQYEAHQSKYDEHAEWGGHRSFAFALRGDQVEGFYYWDGRAADGKQLCAPFTSTLTGTLSQDRKVLNMKYESRRDELGCQVRPNEMTLLKLE